MRQKLSTTIHNNHTIFLQKPFFFKTYWPIIILTLVNEWTVFNAFQHSLPTASPQVSEPAACRPRMAVSTDLGSAARSFCPLGKWIKNGHASVALHISSYIILYHPISSYIIINHGIHIPYEQISRNSYHIITVERERQWPRLCQPWPGDWNSPETHVFKETFLEMSQKKWDGKTIS